MTSALRDQLQTIYDQLGELTPKIVVDEARPADHPLHGRFEWADDVAAERWRQQQAHELIRSVRIVYREPEAGQPERTVRAFHAVRSERGFTYEPAQKVADDPFKRRLVLADMEREWRALYRRYREFAEFTDMVRADLDGLDQAA